MCRRPTAPRDAAAPCFALALCIGVSSALASPQPAAVGGVSTRAALGNGVPVTGLSGSEGTEHRYEIELPSGVTELTVTLESGSDHPWATLSRAPQGSVEPRIIGGEDASIEDYPWQVALLSAGSGGYYNRQFCGGSILSDEWVLTAAHCIDGSAVEVLAGSDNLDAGGGQEIAVAQAYVHPSYDEDTSDNDIALLRLATPLVLSTPKAKPVALMNAAAVTLGLQAPGVEALISGWGNVSTTGTDYPAQLQEAVVPVLASNDPGITYPSGWITAGMLPAGYVQGGIDTCQGDSGGPLVVPDATAQSGYRLAGVTSWGIGCALAGYPGVYARVSHYQAWVEDYVMDRADLYLREGAAPSTTSFDCRSAGAYSDERCVLRDPPAGTYHIMVRGSGSFSDVTLTATWSGTGTHTVTAQAGSGGSISPASAEVATGETARFRVNPDDGYSIEDVTGCSGTLAGDIYTTGPINAACIVRASFASSAPVGECFTDARPLGNLIITGADAYSSEVSIAVAGSVSVLAGASLTLKAPTLTFGPDFRVALGGELSAIASNVVCNDAASSRQEPVGRRSAVGGDGSAAAGVALSGPSLIMPAVALPEWLGLWLSDRGIDVQGVDDVLLAADESWLVITTTQALAAGDANRTSDVYRIDLGTDRIDLVSRTPRGTAGNGASGYPAADASGELIAFHSDADDLTPGDNNGVRDVFLHDWALSQTTRLTEAERAAARPALDAAGALLLYDQEDVTGRRQILGRLPSAAEPPMQLSLGEDPSGWPLDSHHAAVSADGRFVVYLEQRPLPANEPASELQQHACGVHLFDRHTEVYHRQACPAPLAADADAARAAFSADARRIEWNLPGQGVRLILPNPLLPPVDD